MLYVIFRLTPKPINYFPYFKDEETKAYRNEVTCSNYLSHITASKW